MDKYLLKEPPLASAGMPLSTKVLAAGLAIWAMQAECAWAQISPGVTFGYSFTSSGQLVETASSRTGTYTLVGSQDARTYTVSGPGVASRSFSSANAGTNLADASAFLVQSAESGATSFNPAASTSIDPAAGNPSSLNSRMTAGNFQTMTGIGGFEPEPPPPSAELAHVPNALTAGGEFGYGNAAGQGVFESTIPISYTIFAADPKQSLTIDVPLTYLNIGGVGAEQVSIGATYRYPLTDRWSLAAGARFGMSTAGLIQESDVTYLFSIGSIYRIYFSDYKVTIGNSVGVVKSSPVGIYANPYPVNTTNVPIVNGIGIEGSLGFTVFDRPGSWEAYVIDTYLAGTKLSIQHFDEIGVNFGTRGVVGQQLWNNFRIGIAYTFGPSFNMVSIQGNYRF